MEFPGLSKWQIRNLAASGVIGGVAVGGGGGADEIALRVFESVKAQNSVTIDFVLEDSFPTVTVYKVDENGIAIASPLDYTIGTITYDDATQTGTVTIHFRGAFVGVVKLTR